MIREPTIQSVARSIAFVAVILVVLLACAHLGKAPSPERPTVRVTLAAGAAGPEIPPDFVGLSYEKSFLSLPVFDADDPAMVALFRRLGPGVLRVGGNSVDRTSWDPTGPGMRKALIAPADISRLARFLQAADWRLIYGLNMGTSTPEAMAEEASAAKAALGSRLMAFEIGNEPDLYHKNGLRGPLYSYGDYLKEWNRDVGVVQSMVPGADFAGPAAAGDITRYTVPFGRDTRGRLLLLTQHYYRADGKLPTSTAGLLLSPDPKLRALLRALSDTSRSQQIPSGFRLGEANSFSNGGAPHVSDSFASALWVIDFLFECAESGASGANLHGGGSGPGYTPIANDGQGVQEVRPEYYGLYLFSLAARGMVTRAIVSNAGPSISAGAVAGRDGSIRIILVDKSEGSDVTVDLEVPPTYLTASLLRLSGPSLGAEKGTLLGGAPIKADGSWEKSVEERAEVHGGKLRVELRGPCAVLAIVRADHGGS